MALTLATELANYAAGIGTQGATLKIDSANKRVGVGTTNPQGPEGSLQVGTGITFFGNTGIISAIGGKFSGDFTVGGTLTYEDVQNVNSSGIVTAQSGVRIVGGGLTVTGVSTFFSNIDLPDNVKLNIGTGDDLQIYHDGSNSYIKETAGTGNLRIEANDLRLKNGDGTEDYIKCNQNAAVELFHNDVKKFETGPAGTITVGVSTADGFDVGDNEYITAGIGSDLAIYHDGSHSHIVSNTGNLRILADGSGDLVLTSKAGEEAITCAQDGAVTIKHDNSTKLTTKSDGVDITGELQSDTLDVDGAANIQGSLTVQSDILMGDDDLLKLGDSDDLQISHDGSTNIIDGRFHPIELRHQSEVHIKCVDDGTVELYHNNSKKLETSSSGVTVTGTLNATTDVQINGKGAATTGKAIAMAMIFG